MTFQYLHPSDRCSNTFGGMCSFMQKRNTFIADEENEQKSLDLY